MWPFTRKAEERAEQRAGGYADTVIAGLLARAAGVSSGDAVSLAAVEVAAGLWGRGFAAARVTPSTPATAALTADVLALMGRELVRRGEALFVIVVDDGMVSLHPASSWDISGGWHPDTWSYRVDLAGPSSSTAQRLPASAVVHARFAMAPSRPWQGMGPLSFASSSAALAADVEARLAEEAAATSGYLLPVPAVGAKTGPDGETVDPLAKLREDIKGLKGRAGLVETTAAAWGDGRVNAPATDWQQRRIGIDPPAALDALRSHAGLDVLAACGVPISLATDADGTSQREAWRRFSHGTLAPMLAAVAVELSAKLDAPGLAFDLSALYASDLVGRAGAAARLVGAGMALPDALDVAGLA